MTRSTGLLLLLFLVSFITSSHRDQLPSVEDRTTINNLQESLKKEAQKVKQLEVELGAKNRLIKAHMTILEDVEGGERAFTAFKSQLSKLAFKNTLQELELDTLEQAFKKYIKDNGVGVLTAGIP